jgi:hypothetical protein
MRETCAAVHVFEYFAPDKSFLFTFPSFRHFCRSSLPAKVNTALIASRRILPTPAPRNHLDGGAEPDANFRPEHEAWRRTADPSLPCSESPQEPSAGLRRGF